MKKLLIAGLIASTSLMAVADTTTLYGAVGYTASLGKNTEDTYKGKKSRANLDTDELWWGIKGDEEINGDELKASWKLEFGEKNMRRAWVALEGKSWGKATLGTQDSLFKDYTNYNDIFEADTFWNSTTRYEEGLVRPSNAIRYDSPNWAGFEFGVAAILNGKDNIIKDNAIGLTDGAQFVKSKNKAIGAGQIGVRYNPKENPFYASLAYEYIDGNFSWVKDYGIAFDKNGNVVTKKDASGKDVIAKAGDFKNSNINGKGGTELIGLSVGYGGKKKGADFQIGLTEQHKASDGDKATLAGEYYFGNNTIRAGVSYASSKALNRAAYNSYEQKLRTTNQVNKGNNAYVDNNNVYTYALGYQYDLSKRTYTFVEANYTDWNRVSKRNGYEAKVGLRHDF